MTIDMIKFLGQTLLLEQGITMDALTGKPIPAVRPSSGARSSASRRNRQSFKLSATDIERMAAAEAKRERKRDLRKTKLHA